MKGEVTVILNGFNRPENLSEQIDAINNQTIKPKEILLWLNNSEGFDKNLTDKITTVTSNKNFGVWARFAFALNANTEYICIFDDDTIPGVKWLENCVETMKTHEGLLGTKGLVYRDDTSYHYHDVYGWDNPNTETVQVDIVGHAWFFKREWLWVMFRELPPQGHNFHRVGEDMFFSYTLKKYLDINTYVPPHPINQRELWGSLKGWQYGTIKASSELSIGEMQHFYSKLILSGWKILRSGNYVKPILTYPQSFVNNQHINFIHQYTVPEDVKGGVCVDIGANCGSFTEVYKEYFSKIYFIEPQKSLYENVANKFKDYDHIVGFNYAVWNKDDEELTLVNHSNKDSGSVGVKGGSINQDWTDEIVNFVTSISLESLYEKIEGVIDYMKIDCENSEYEFLYGKDLSRIKYIGMELHNQMGSDKFYSLCEYIKKTHSLINGKEEFFDNAHQILLYKLK
jgi:FkbM family methyltransferase